MRVLFTDSSDSTLVCAIVNEVRYDRASRTMCLVSAEFDFEAGSISPSVYESFLSQLLTSGYLDLSSWVFREC